MCDDLQPYAAGIGTYVNVLNDPDEDRIRASYGPAKYERLSRIKAEHDPDNVLHFNANIKRDDGVSLTGLSRKPRDTSRGREKVHATPWPDGESTRTCASRI